MLQVVFVGRSNVGKSSLVNYLLNRKVRYFDRDCAKLLLYCCTGTACEIKEMSCILMSHCNFYQMLAPTSATPGFTRAFHFYSVNQPPQPALAEVRKITHNKQRDAVPTIINGAKNKPADPQVPKIRQALPGFRLVDVPGLGYAGEDTGEDTQRSWQGLLSRYLSRRDPLKVVFHLIDARHGVTAVDKEVRYNT